ncbi:hypothetical protein [Nocardia nova]|uniref:hypothetical protein n=1 Tax=Nocardia nova TaxID=37330 RepID=UPI002738A01B|nr:hypothetical protein [Nocardia nova]
MSVIEPVAGEAQRGVIALDHMLTCQDIARAQLPAARAGDVRAAELIHLAAQHMRRLKGV